MDIVAIEVGKPLYIMVIESGLKISILLLESSDKVTPSMLLILLISSFSNGFEKTSLAFKLSILIQTHPSFGIGYHSVPSSLYTHV